MTRQELAHAARLHGYPVGAMAWALDPQRPGECAYLGGCHEVADGHDGMCAAHRIPGRSLLDEPAVAYDEEDPNRPGAGER